MRVLKLLLMCVFAFDAACFFGFIDNGGSRAIADHPDQSECLNKNCAKRVLITDGKDGCEVDAGGICIGGTCVRCDAAGAGGASHCFTSATKSCTVIPAAFTNCGNKRTLDCTLGGAGKPPGDHTRGTSDCCPWYNVWPAGSKGGACGVQDCVN